MPANSRLSLIKASSVVVLSLVSILGSTGALGQTEVWGPGRNILLNDETDRNASNPDGQLVSFRAAVGDNPLLFARSDVAMNVTSVVVTDNPSDIPGLEVIIVDDTCIRVSNDEGVFPDWGGSSEAITLSIFGQDQFGNPMQEPLPVGSVKSISGQGNSESENCRESAPVAVADTYTFPQGATLQNLDIVANDTPQFPIGAPETILSFDASQAVAAGAGSFTIGADSRSIDWAPNANFSGTFTLTYDIQGDDFSTSIAGVGSAPGTVTVTVTAVNAPPDAVDDPDVTTPAGQPITISVLSNDSDPEDDPITIVSVSDPPNGTASIVNNNSQILYEPDSGFADMTDMFSYTISAVGGTDTAVVTVAVGAVANLRPDAMDDLGITTPADQPITISVLSNDVDPDDGPSPLTITSVEDPANGTTAIVNNDTEIVYTPNQGFSSTVPDSFNYTISDGSLTDSARVEVLVTPPANAAPDAQPDQAEVEEGRSVSINVLANDTDPEGNALTVSAVTQPANGTAVIDAGMTSVTYTPRAGFADDTDTFTYDVTDGESTSSATVTVTVNGRFRLESIARTPNQRSVAIEVDDLCPKLNDNSSQLDVDQRDLLTKCTDIIADQDDPDAQRDALDEISGQEISAQQTTGIDFTQVQLTNVGARMQALRQGVRGSSFAGLRLYHEGEYIPAEQLAAMVKDLAGGGSGDEDSSEPLQSRWGFFGRGKINVGDKDASDNEAGFDFESWGVTLGVDYRFTDNFVLGVAGGFNSGEAEFDEDGGEMESEGTSAHLFGVLWGDHAYLDFVASFGQLDYDSVRNIAYTDVNGPISETAVGSTEGDVTALGIAFGYEFNKGAWSFTPNIAATMIEVDVDPFMESGALGLDLSFDKQTAESRTIEGGFRLSYTSSREWGVIIPELRASFVKENDNDSEILNVKFVNDPFANDPSQPTPGITLITDDPDDSYVRLGFALNAQFQSGFSGFVDYETLSGLSLVSSHEFTFGLRYQRQFR